MSTTELITQTEQALQPRGAMSVQKMIAMGVISEEESEVLLRQLFSTLKSATKASEVSSLWRTITTLVNAYQKHSNPKQPTLHQHVHANVTHDEADARRRRLSEITTRVGVG